MRRANELGGDRMSWVVTCEYGARGGDTSDTTHKLSGDTANNQSGDAGNELGGDAVMRQTGG